MTGDKKEKLLKKYLEKKRRQTRRDELFEKICAVSRNSERSASVSLLKTKLKKPKEKNAKKQQTGSGKGAIRDCGAGHPEVQVGKWEDTASSDPPSDAEESSGVTGTAPPSGLTQPPAELNATEEASVPISPETARTPIGIAEQACPRASIEDGGAGLMRGPHGPNDIDFSREEFHAEKCDKRTEEVQEARRKLAVFYEEHDIVRQIKAHKTTFICGDTGSGKTTQIPQFLLENGFRDKGLIGVTQPRRLAAIAAAARINSELNENLCGYKIKYENNVTSDTRIKIMTEGILFREIQTDFFLSKYCVIILDEVHERTVSMDILVGLLGKIVSLRFSRGDPLRLVLMSATVDAEDFRAVLGPFHSISLQGHSYKVSVFYEDRTEEDYVGASHRKIMEILRAEKSPKKTRRQVGPKAGVHAEIINDINAGILVFLPTKQDIYALKSRLESECRECIVLPLHSSLSREEQCLAYKRYDSRKIILATNVAETSITIDDVVFVVDSGRVKHRIREGSCVKYQIGFTSKSSARQRMGRAGRTGPGVCFRVYSGRTYESFQEKNTPLIYMEPLDGTLLQLKLLGIENFFTFPLISPPDTGAVREAVGSLQRLGALSAAGGITSLGRKMAAYSIPPRYACLLCISGADDVFRHLAVAAAILSVGFDVAKTETNKPFFDNERSDVIVYMKLYYACVGRQSMGSFARKHGLSIHAIQEVSRLSRYLASLSGNDALCGRQELDEGDCKKVCKALYSALSDQLAVNAGTSYVYKGGDVCISNDSINVGNENIIFDYIVCGRHRDYVKNITIVERAWFKGKQD